jgi:hypothetical protein
MGVFTIYDWGNGAAAEAAMRVLDHYGHVYIDRTRNRAFGLDKIQVRRCDQGWELVNKTNQPRSVCVVFDDGSTQQVQITDKTLISFGDKR